MLRQTEAGAATTTSRRPRFTCTRWRSGSGYGGLRSSGELVEQRLRVLQVSGVEALGEPAVDRYYGHAEQVASELAELGASPDNHPWRVIVSPQR